MRKRKRRTLGQIADFAVRVVGTVVLVCALAYTDAKHLVKRRRTKRVEPEPEPTTVDELVNSASIAGPVTMVMGASDGTLN